MKFIDSIMDWFGGLTFFEVMLAAFVGGAFGVWLALVPGCGQEQPDPFVTVDGGQDLTKPTQQQGSSASTGGGHVPIDFYPRQCQWDACGGPLPDRQKEEQP